MKTGYVLDYICYHINVHMNKETTYLFRIKTIQITYDKKRLGLCSKNNFNCDSRKSDVKHT